MVSKTKLKSELQGFNDHLDKYMKRIDFEGLEDQFYDTNFSKELESRENVILLSENLKEVRYELNMMRKNMTSDVGVMVSKELQKLKSSFFDELISSQNHLYEHIKTLDMTPVKEIVEEVENIKSQQLEISNALASLQENISKKFVEVNMHEEKRICALVEQFKLSHSALLKKFHQLDGSIKEMDNMMGGVSHELHGHRQDVLASLQDVETRYNAVKLKSKEVSAEQLNHFEEQMEKTKAYLEQTPVFMGKKVTLPNSSASSNFNEAKEWANQYSSPSYDTKPAQRLLSIDEKLQRLNELR